MIVFACISPHPPLLLPGVGSEKDKKEVLKTIKSLELLRKSLEKIAPDLMVISSPHPDWGFNVPLHFLAKDFKGEIKPYLTSAESPEYHFREGSNFYKSNIANYPGKVALIASGDLSHCLKEDGPYGFHPDGPKFDNVLIKYLKSKDIKNFLKLDKTFPDAGECGLRSFCFLLGILEEAKMKWLAEILSYESPFGVGYLVANFKI